ncbi:MAG: MFS transporter [Acetobacteraceae bacterium]|nr:MFS transporter [Acetobacteraceae bacterium]
MAAQRGGVESTGAAGAAAAGGIAAGRRASVGGPPGSGVSWGGASDGGVSRGGASGGGGCAGRASSGASSPAGGPAGPAAGAGPRAGAGRLAPLKSRNFALLWSGGLVSSIGDSLSSFALMAFIYALSSRSLPIARLYALALLPSLLVSLPVGVLVDRFSRRNLMILVDLLRAGLVLGFILARLPWHFYLVYTLSALLAQLYEPARNSLVPAVAGEGRYLAANALLLLNLEVARVVGPALSGWVSSLWGPKVVFGLDSLSFGLSALALAFMAFRGRAAPVGRGSGAELREGLKAMVSDPRVAYATGVNLLAWLAAGASPLVVYAFGRQHLGLGDAGAGLLLSAMGAGMILGSAVLGGLRSRRDQWPLMAGSLAASGVSVVLMGWLGGFWWSMICRFSVGVAWVAYRSSSLAILQEVVPDRYRGRVFAAYNFALILAMILSFLGLGALPDVVGPQWAVLCSGFWFLLVGVLAAVRRPPAPQSGASQGVGG